jgi:hypothetical protein
MPKQQLRDEPEEKGNGVQCRMINTESIDTDHNTGILICVMGVSRLSHYSQLAGAAL